MDAEVFWNLLEEACRMGRFMAAVPNPAASANIVGKLEVGADGDERVLQKRKRPNSHVHFKPEAVTQFAFVYYDLGEGPAPCLEVRADGGLAVLRLYYQGKKPARRYDEFMRAAAGHEEFVTGTWGAPVEEVTGEAASSSNEEALFVGTGDAAAAAEAEEGGGAHVA